MSLFCNRSSAKGASTCVKSRRLAWKKATSGCPTSTRISSASRRSSICCRRPASLIKSGNRNQSQSPLVTRAARTKKLGCFPGSREETRRRLRGAPGIFPEPLRRKPSSPHPDRHCRAATRYLSLLSSVVCRPDVEAAASHRAACLRVGHVDQSQQSRPRRRPRHFCHGERSRRGNRGNVWLDEFSSASLRRRHHGQSRSVMGRKAASAWQENRGECASPLHAPSYQQCFAIRI